MFLGAVPSAAVAQIIRIVPFSEWSSIYIGCSGSFRVEFGLRKAYPTKQIFSNDVSLYSCAVGYLLSGQTMPITFIDQLAFIEEHLATQEEDHGYGSRVAAVLVAAELCRFLRGRSDFAIHHMEHYRSRFAEFHRKALASVEKLRKGLPLDGYFAGDWRDHVRTAIAQGAGVAAFPPFFRGDYESQYRVLDKNTDWPRPSYDLYSPGDLRGVVDMIEEAGTPYCILSDQLWEDKRPVAEFVAGRKVPHYVYASSATSSVIRRAVEAWPFRYERFDVGKVRPDSQLKAVICDGRYLNFIKDQHLSKNIIHTDGMVSFLIFLDSMLLGGLVYSLHAKTQRAEHGWYSMECIYLMSDVTTTREAKISKLVAYVATSKAILSQLRLKFVLPIDRVVTTARSSKSCFDEVSRDIYPTEP